jgi:hypothetical protein
MSTPNQAGTTGGARSAPGKTVPGGGLGTGTGAKPGTAGAGGSTSNGTSN